MILDPTKPTITFPTIKMSTAESDFFQHNGYILVSLRKGDNLSCDLEECKYNNIPVFLKSVYYKTFVCIVTDIKKNR